LRPKINGKGERNFTLFYSPALLSSWNEFLLALFAMFAYGHIQKETKKIISYI